MEKPSANPKAAGLCEIRLLGRFRVAVGGRTIEDSDWPRRKARQLLKLLALAPQHKLHRDQVMEHLWPESKIRSTANNLNKTVHMLRRVLEPDLEAGSESRFLTRDAEQIALEADTLRIDFEAFEQQAKAALAGQEADAYESALRLYAGDLLSEDLYEDWAWSKRDQLRMLHHQLLFALARIHQEEEQFQPAIDRLNQLLVEEPSNEAAHRQLMRIYARMGHRQQALRQYERCRDALKRDLDAEPEESTVRLHQEIAEGKFRPAQASHSDVSSAAEVDSLAILPFENASQDPELRGRGNSSRVWSPCRESAMCRPIPRPWCRSGWEKPTRPWSRWKRP